MPVELLCPSPVNDSVNIPPADPPTPGPTSQPAVNRWAEWPGRRLGALLLLLPVVFAIYAPSLNGQFLWDDTGLVKNNLLIRSPLFCLEVFRHTLFNDESNFYRPTQTLTFIADYWFGGTNPFVYHLTSVLIHAGNALLLCLVLRIVLPTLLAGATDTRRTNHLALGIALVWAVHPVHSAAVAYISGTADTLAMTCCLAAALLCERALRSPRLPARVGWGAGALLGLLLGLCAKEIASVWLALFFGYLFALRANTSRRARWTTVALAAAALLAYVGLRHLPSAPPPVPPTPQMPARGILMLRALGDYGSLLLFPNKLFMERQVFAPPGLADAPDAFFYQMLTVSGALVLAAFAFGCYWPGRGQRLRRAGVSWFMAGFLPISNLFALNASVAEHWLYLPSIGFLLFLAGVGFDVPTLRRRLAFPVLLACVGVAVAALGLRTWYRTFDWTDELTFFRQTIADGGDVPRARAGLAAAYGRQVVSGDRPGADDQAIATVRSTVRNFPRMFGPRINLATLLARRGNTDEAKTILEAVAPDLLNSRHSDPHELVTALRGLDLLESEDPRWPEHRRALLDHGLGQHPDSWDLVNYGVQNLERAGRPEAALALAQRYADVHWWHAPVRLMIGQLQGKLNRTDHALAAWTEASRLDVHDAEAFSRAALLCLQDGRLREAHAYQSDAVRRQPDSPRQHLLFAQVLEREHNPSAARAEVTLANSLVEQSAESN